MSKLKHTVFEVASDAGSLQALLESMGPDQWVETMVWANGKLLVVTVTKEVALQKNRPIVKERR